MKEGAREPLEVLLELTRALGRQRSLEEALQTTTDAALELLPGNHTSLRLFDDERRVLLSSARSGVGHERPPAIFRAGEGVLGLVADTGQGRLIEDSELEPSFSKAVPLGFPVRSLVAVPLFAGAQVVGVLSASAAEAGAFSPRDRDLAQLLANCTAPALQTARLARLAVTDDLTRAYNARYLGPRLEEEINRAKRDGVPFALLMLDLDHFKRVNDAHGHAAGDEVLTAFADRVREAVRQTDILVRRGGEEFLILMPSTELEVAERVAERVRASVADAPFVVGGGAAIEVTVSVGVAVWDGREGPAALEARADAALYEAKHRGRDRVESWRPGRI